jgi:hypothetical protein
VGEVGVDAPAILARDQRGDYALELIQRCGISRHRKTLSHSFRRRGIAQLDLVQKDGQDETQRADARRDHEHRPQRRHHRIDVSLMKNRRQTLDRRRNGIGEKIHPRRA